MLRRWVAWAPAPAWLPELWRDGIAAARADRVALAVVDCLPAAGWLEALLRADLDHYAAVGGAIDRDPSANGVATAIYLLRPDRGLLWRLLRASKATERVLVEDALKHLFDC